jgi:hypothetical protein
MHQALFIVTMNSHIMSVMLTATFTLYVDTVGPQFVRTIIAGTRRDVRRAFHDHQVVITTNNTAPIPL